MESQFVRRGAGWGVEVGSYDPREVLVVDPLVYSTYLGGSQRDRGHDIAVDGNGQAYVTGYTRSADFPTQNPYQMTAQGNSDAFAVKIELSDPDMLGDVPGQSRRGGTFEVIDLWGRVIEAYEDPTGQAPVPFPLRPGVYFIRETQSGAARKVLILE